MNLIKLQLTEKNIKEYNDNIERCKKEYPDMKFPDIAESADDIFCPYVNVINNEDNKKYLDILDTMENFDGIYKGDNYHIKIENHSDYSFRKDPYDYIGTLETEVITPYGVADNATQVVEYFKDFEKRNNIDLGDCVICMHPIVKEFQPDEGGWRWHKWGRYIGVKDPQCEYIKEENDSIKMVWCFHIYFVEKK